MFAKVFGQIYDSSISEDYLLRLVFEDFLTLADINGVVDMTQESISRRTNVPLDIVKKYITILESPDLKSRRKNDDGRRIVKLDEHRDWGWLIVNYEFYRNLASEDQRREKTRQRVIKYRQKTSCNALKRIETDSNDSPSSSPSSSSSLKGGVGEVPEPLKTPEFLEAWDNWKQHCKEIKKPLTVQSVKMQMKEFLAWGPTGSVEAIEFTIKKGWQGIRRPDEQGLASAKPSGKPRVFVSDLRERIKILDSERERLRNSFNFPNKKDDREKMVKFNADIKATQGKILEATK